MNVAESARFAWRGVTANKPRSALTTLGVMIGVASVIILIAVGTGSSRAVQEQISSLGSNTLDRHQFDQRYRGPRRRGRSDFPGGGGFPGAPGGDASSATDSGTKTRSSVLSLADAQALTDQDLAPDVLAVAPVVSATSVTATYSGASHTVNTTTGSSPSYLAINNDTVEFRAQLLRFRLHQPRSRRPGRHHRSPRIWPAVTAAGCSTRWSV